MIIARALEVFRQKAFPGTQQFEYGTKFDLNGMNAVTLTCAPSVTENVIKTRIHNDQVILKVMEFMTNQAELSIEEISNRLEYCLMVFQHYLFNRYKRNRATVEKITANFPIHTYITHLYVIPQWLFTIYSIIHLQTNVLFINSKEYLPVFLFDPVRKNTHVIQVDHGTKRLVLSCEQQKYNSTFRISQFQGHLMNALFKRPTIHDQLYAPFILDNITKVEYEDIGTFNFVWLKFESSKWVIYEAYGDVKSSENIEFMMNADQLTSMIKDNINLYGLFNHKCYIGFNVFEKYLKMQKVEHNTHLLKLDKNRTVNLLRFNHSDQSFQDLCNFLVFIHMGELWNHEDLNSNIFDRFNAEHNESYKFGYNAKLAYLGRYLRVNIVEIINANKIVVILMNSRFQYTYAVNYHEKWGILYQKNHLGFVFGQNKNKISREHDEFQVNLDRANRATNVAIAIKHQEEERKRRTENVELSQERRERQKREVDAIILRKGKLGKQDLNAGKRVAILIKAKNLEKEVAENLEKYHAKKTAELAKTAQLLAEQERNRLENARIRLEREAEQTRIREEQAAKRALWIAEQEQINLQKAAEVDRLRVEETERVRKATITYWATARREAHKKERAAEAAALKDAEEKARAERDAQNALNMNAMIEAARQKFDAQFPKQGLVAKSQSAIKGEGKTPARAQSEEPWKPAKKSDSLPVVAQQPVRREYNHAHYEHRKLDPYNETDLHVIKERFHELKRERQEEAKRLEEKRLEEERKQRIKKEIRAVHLRLVKKERIFKKLKARRDARARVLRGDAPQQIPIEIPRLWRERMKPARKQVEEKKAQENDEKAAQKRQAREETKQKLAEKAAEKARMQQIQQERKEKREAFLKKKRQDIEQENARKLAEEEKAQARKERKRSKKLKAINFERRTLSTPDLLKFRFHIAKTIGDIIFLRVQHGFKDYTVSYIVNLIRYASSSKNWSRPNQLATQPYALESIISEFPHIQITLVSKSGIVPEETHTPSYIEPKNRVVLYESTSKTLYVVAKVHMDGSIDIFHQLDEAVPKVDVTPSKSRGLITRIRTAWNRIRHAIRKAFRIKSSPAEREDIKELRHDKKKPSENPYGDPQEANRAALVRRILRTSRNKHRSKQDQASRAAVVRRILKI